LGGGGPITQETNPGAAVTEAAQKRPGGIEISNGALSDLICRKERRKILSGELLLRRRICARSRHSWRWRRRQA